MPNSVASSRVVLLLLIFVHAVPKGVHGECTGAACCATIVGVTAVTSYAGYRTIRCRFNECCCEPWIQPDISGLSHALSVRLHGQHLVKRILLSSVEGHIKYSHLNKALVLSFHGWTGNGKNLVSHMVVEHFYHLGLRSEYVHLIHVPSVFPHKSELHTYQIQLREWVRGNMSSCDRHLFIFDELDKMPEGLIDVIKPFLDFYPRIDDVDYRNNIFIFLSNSGGREINEYVLSQWREGRKREDIKFRELEEILIRTVFNDAGGLWHSTIIDNSLVSAFIPFLPMERQYVKMCIRDDLLAKKLPVTDMLVDQVAEELMFFPNDLKLYSTTGCKRVSQKVDTVVAYNTMYDD